MINRLAHLFPDKPDDPKQPMPAWTTLAKLNIYVAITRFWRNGDAKKCTLCKTCVARRVSKNGHVCTVATIDSIHTATAAQAAMFSPRKMYGQ